MKEELNTEQAILAAAEKEFMNKGYAMTKTTEIAKAAGVTHAMLHYYFRTKENLFDMVFRKKAALMASSFINIVDNDLSFFEKLRLAIEAHFDYIAQSPKLPLFILSEIAGNEERLTILKNIFIPILGETTSSLSKSINEEVAKGTIRPITPLDLIIDVVALNAFVFIAQPILKLLTEANRIEYQDFLNHRREENVQLMISRLKV